MDSLDGSLEKLDVTIDDILLALEYDGMPKMIVKYVANGFVLVPFDAIIRKAYNKDYEPLHYAFVNREMGMYKFVFSSFDDLAETLFNAKEICHGCYPIDAEPNPLYGKSIEQLKIEQELTSP